MLCNVLQMAAHRTGSPHPERPQRLVACYKRLWEAGIVQRCKVRPSERARARASERAQARPLLTRRATDPAGL
jgi:hypothetical protein